MRGALFAPALSKSEVNANLDAPQVGLRFVDVIDNPSRDSSNGALFQIFCLGADQIAAPHIEQEFFDLVVFVKR